MKRTNKVTYRQQYTRCGKQRCRKCQEGNGHGPYWYAYWSQNGRTISKYVGVRLPDGIKEAGHTQILEAVSSVSSDYTGSPWNNEQTEVTAQLEVPPSFPPCMQKTQILRVYLLGQFHIERKVGDQWHRVDNQLWRRRARTLLSCLLSSQKRRMGREQIMEALWPDVDAITAANRLNGAVHELRRLLEPELTRPSASRMLRSEQDILELADSSLLWVDADAFDQLVGEAFALLDNETGMISGRKQAEHLLEEAERLYTGDYLPEELYSGWSSSRRETLRRAYSSLLFRLSQLRIQRDALASAIEPLDRLLASDPVNETAVRQLMILLARLDRRTEALHIYKRLVIALQRDYEIEPLPETRELYEILKKGELSTALHISAIKHAEQPAPVEDQEKLFCRPVFQSSRHNQSPLIGRDRELDTMRQFMHSIEGIEKRGSRNSTAHYPQPVIPHFLLLTGEPGIGKTRLAEELSLEGNERGWAVAWSRSYEQENTLPYRVWTELLHTLVDGISPEYLLTILKQYLPGFNESTIRLDRLSTLLPALAVHNGSRPLRPSPTPEQERLHLWEIILGLLSALSQEAPLLLVIDDLHWTDESSIDLLAYLARHLQRQRVLLLGTYRDTEQPPNSKLRTLINDLRREEAFLMLVVQPLTSTQIGSLVSYLPEEVVRRIQAQAGGNPFFAEELARCSLPESSYAEGTVSTPSRSDKSEREITETTETTTSSIASVERGPLPEAIAAVLERRLAALSSRCQSLLSRAAVLGGSFKLQHLLAMANDYGEDILLDLLEEALQAGLLVEEGSGEGIIYRFWHPLIVGHLYQRLSAARRTQLHRRAANILEQCYTEKGQEGAATIMYHLSKAGNDPMLLAHYAILAANHAYALTAYSEAKKYYIQAIQILSQQSASPGTALQLARLQERVCECCMVLGDYSEARKGYEHILELRGDLGSSQQEIQIQALIWREIGRTWSATGDYMLAFECFEQGRQALVRAGITNGPAWACLLIQHGAICCLQGSYEQARDSIYQGLEMLERAMQDSQNVQPCPSTDFRTQTEQVIAGDSLELGRAHELLGVVAASVGHVSEALKHLYTALDIFERNDLVIAMAKVCGNLGAVYAMKGEHNQARLYMHRSLELAERMGDLPNMAFVTGNLGEMASRHGDLQEAEEWFTRSLAISEQINDREHSSWCNVALGAVRQAQGKFAEASVNLGRALALGRAMKNSRCIGSALVTIADLRIRQAISVGMQYLPFLIKQDDLQEGELSRQNITVTSMASSRPMIRCHRLLLRARTTLQQALAIEGLEAEVVTEGRSLLATTSFLLGELEIAQTQALQTMQAAEEHEITRLLARSYRLLGRIMAIQGLDEQASGSFEEALRIFQENEMRLEYAYTLHSYGISLLQRSSTTEADYRRGITCLQEACDIFTTCHAAIDLEWVSFQLTDYETRQLSLP